MPSCGHMNLSNVVLVDTLKTVTHGIAAVLLTLVAGAACRTADSQVRPPIVQPGAPGEDSHVIAAEQAVDLSHVQATAADVRFMQGMIHHHAQALDMTALLPTDRKSTRLNSSHANISYAVF